MDRIAEIDVEIVKFQEAIRVLQVEKETILSSMTLTIPPGIRDIFILDLEHTDRKIIQIAVKSLRTSQVFLSYVNPSCQISDIVKKLTGISQETVDCSPSFPEVLPKFLKFLNGTCLDSGELLGFPVFFVAHNGRSCDFPILIGGLGDKIKVTKHYWVDSYNDLEPAVFKRKLSDAFPDRIQTHDALEDVLMLEELLKKNWGSVCTSLATFQADRKCPERFQKPLLIQKKILSQAGIMGISKEKKEVILKLLKDHT